MSWFTRKFSPRAAESAVDEQLTQLDACSGVREALSLHGLPVKSLRAAWRDEESRQGLLYFLVPLDKTANFGWFTPDELLEWTRGRGPVVLDTMLEELEGLNDYARRADNLLASRGVLTRTKCSVAWVSPESKIPGARVLVHEASRDVLDDGVYSLDHLDVLTAMPLIPE